MVEYTSAQIKEAKSDAGPAALAYIEELEDRVKKLQEICKTSLTFDCEETNSQVARLQERLDYCNEVIGWASDSLAPVSNEAQRCVWERAQIERELEELQKVQETQQELARVLS